MNSPNRRRADRLEVGFSAKLMTHISFVDAAVRDLSRTGVRLRLSGESLGFPITADLVQLERRLRAILPDPLFVTLDDGRLGSLIQKLAVVRRLGLPADRVATLDLCCEFTEPLADEETHVLSLPLPSVKEDVEHWQELPNGHALAEAVTSAPSPESPQAPAASDPPRHRYRVLVSSTRPKAPPSLFCYTDLVTRIGLRIRLPLGQLRGSKDPEVLAAKDAIRLLVKRYGRYVDVRVFDGGDDLWRGSMRITGAELPSRAAAHLLVSLAFAGDLKRSEMRRLGLLPSAA